MSIRLIAVGKIKEEYLVKGILEYQKRLSAYTDFKIIEVKETTTSDVKKNLSTEGKEIMKNINDEDYVVTLEILGEMITSVDLASKISKHFLYNNSNIVFVIGSSDGLCDEVLKRSNYKLSFSKMTFPHQLMRLIFMEQLYRSYTIINNQKYHK